MEHNHQGGECSSTVPPVEVATEDQDSILLLERRSFRPFKNAEDYLYAMREDLAEWLNGLYDLNITVDDFFERLENGVVLCEVRAVVLCPPARDALWAELRFG